MNIFGLNIAFDSYHGGGGTISFGGNETIFGGKKQKFWGGNDFILVEKSNFEIVPPPNLGGD